MRLLLVLTLFIAAGHAGQLQAQLAGLKPEITGAWFNPVQDGHGFNVQALDEQTLLVFWYTYNPDGTSTFLLGIVEDDGSGRYVGTLQQTDGMVFGEFDPTTVVREDWGTLTVEFGDCGTGTVSWTSTAPGFPDGSIPIQRLTATHLGTCTDDPVVGNYAVTYLDEDGRYEGNALFLPDGRLFFAAGENDIEFVGGGAWRQTGRLAFEIDGTSYETDPFGGPPLDTETVETSAILNVNGFGDSAQTTIGSIQFRGTFLRDYRRAIGQAILAGSYQLVDEVAGGPPLGTIEVAQDGAVTGTLFNGCSLAGGAMVITTPGTNQFTVDLLVDDDDPDCADLDFRGAGFLIDEEDIANPCDLFTILENEDQGYASVFRLDRAME